MTGFNRSLQCFTVLTLLAGAFSLPCRAAQETELKDETGKAIVKYIIEVPDGLASAGVTDPIREVGLILCFQEHDTPLGNDLFPVRESLSRQGLSDHYI